MKRKNNIVSIFVLLFTLVIAGCDANTVEDENSNLTLNIEGVVGNQPFSTETTYTLNGQALTFTSGRIYLSEFVLVQEDGTEITLKGESITVPAQESADQVVTHTTDERIVLAKHDAGETLYELGEVPTGVYSGVKMKLGIEGLNNKIDPTQVPANHPLAQQTDRNNHWSWNAGYIFLRMDGYLDLDGDGVVEETEDALWDVHLGTQNFTELLDFRRPFTLSAENHQLHIVVDYAKLIETIDFSDPEQRRCHTMDNLPVAQKVADQYLKSFLLHDTHIL